MKKTAFLLIAVAALMDCNAATRYVMPNAAGLSDGSSWTNASANLQGMIDSSAAGDSVWVAAGKYLPTTDITGNALPTDPRTLTFFLKSGVKMFGSFAGAETSLAQRTLSVTNSNPSFLSGDIGVANDSTDNCYHVVFAAFCDSTTVLDGFTINHGNANGSGYQFVNTTSVSYAWGGGITIIYSPLNISNCIFSGNCTASLGGGMFSTNSSLNISDCVFANNNSFDQGGGWDNQFVSTSNITNCIFYGNHATTGGGILNEINAVLHIMNCVFSGNSATSGGGLSVEFSTLTNSIVWGNTPGPNLDSASYSVIEGATIFPGPGNTNANPRFVNAVLPAGADNIWRTADDGLQILPCSPAVDMGTNTDAPAHDILGNSRYDVPGTGFSDVDMGAYENSANRTIAAFTIAGDTLTADSAGRTYQWIVCPSETPAPGNSTGRTYYATVNGTYQLVITDGECTDTSACTLIGPSGIASISEEMSNLKIYPNPACNYINVAMAINDNYWLTIYDVSGRVRYHEKWVAGGATLDINYLLPGTYFVAAAGSVARLVVER